MEIDYIRIEEAGPVSIAMNKGMCLAIGAYACAMYKQRTNKSQMCELKR